MDSTGKKKPKDTVQNMVRAISSRNEGPLGSIASAKTPREERQATQKGLLKHSSDAKERQHDQFHPTPVKGMSHRTEEDILRQYEKSFADFLRFLSYVLEDNPDKIVGDDLRKARAAAQKARPREKFVVYDTASRVRDDLLRYVRAAGTELSDRLEKWNASQDALDRLNGQCEEMERRLARLKVEEGVAAKMAAMQLEHEAAIKSIREERDRLNASNKELLAEVARTSADLAEQLEQATGRISALTAANTALQKDLVAAQLAAKGQEALLERIKELEAELDKAKLSEAGKDERIRELEGQLAKEKADTARLTKELAESNAARSLLEGEVGELKKRLAEQERLSSASGDEQLRAARKEAQELRDQLEAQAKDLALLRQQLKEAQDRLVAIPVPSEKETASVATSTDDLPKPEVKPAKRPARQPLDLKGIDFRTAAPAASSDRSRALELETPATHPPRREPGLGFDIGALDFGKLFDKATSESFKENKDGTEEGNKKAIFKSFVSALDKYLGSEDDQQKLTTADVEAMNAVEKNSYARGLSPKTEGIDFVTAMQNSQFAAKFMQWADRAAKAIKATSGQYGAASPHSSPQSPFVSEQVSAMEKNLASIEQKLGQSRA